jgi:hypothetical protein
MTSTSDQRERPGVSWASSRGGQQRGDEPNCQRDSQRQTSNGSAARRERHRSDEQRVSRDRHDRLLPGRDQGERSEMPLAASRELHVIELAVAKRRTWMRMSSGTRLGVATRGDKPSRHEDGIRGGDTQRERATSRAVTRTGFGVVTHRERGRQAEPSRGRDSG